MPIPTRSRNTGVAAIRGRILPGLIILPLILCGGAAAVHSLLAGHRFVSAAVSYLGCCFAVFVPVIVAWSVIAVDKGWDERPPSRLVGAVPFVTPIALGAGLYHLIHRVLAVPPLISASKILGSLLIFVVGWALWTDLKERPERYGWAARRP